MAKGRERQVGRECAQGVGPPRPLERRLDAVARQLPLGRVLAPKRPEQAEREKVHLVVELKKVKVLREKIQHFYEETFRRKPYVL